MAIPESRPRPAAVGVDDASFGKFDGIINTKSPKEIGWTGLKSAVNVEIDNEKQIVRRSGYTLFAAGNYRGAYANNSQNFLIAIKDGLCVRVNPDGSTTTRLQA